MNTPEERLRITMDCLIEECKTLDLAELRALWFLARRLALLRQQYGPLDQSNDETREWHGEIREDLADVMLWVALQDHEHPAPGSCPDETTHSESEIARLNERLARIEDRLGRICPLST